MMGTITTYAGTSAVLKLCSGTQPGGGGALTTVLCALTCNATAFAGTPASGSITLNAITSGTVTNTGTATWFRIETSGGTFVLDGDVSTTGSGGDLQLNDVALIQNGSVSLSGPNVLTAGNPP